MVGRNDWLTTNGKRTYSSPWSFTSRTLDARLTELGRSFENSESLQSCALVCTFFKLHAESRSAPFPSIRLGLLGLGPYLTDPLAASVPKQISRIQGLCQFLEADTYLASCIRSVVVSPDFWSYTRVVSLLNQLCFQESWISCRVCNFIPSSSTVCAFQGPRCGYQRFPPLLVLVHSASVCPAFDVLVITALYAFTTSKILDTTSSIVISIAEISSTACSSDPNSLRYKRWC